MNLVTFCRKRGGLVAINPEFVVKVEEGGFENRDPFTEITLTDTEKLRVCGDFNDVVETFDKSRES